MRPRRTNNKQAIPPKAQPKRKSVRKTIELKKELICKYENGSRVSDLAAEYGMAKSTVSSILKRKECIKKANVAKGVTGMNRPPIFEEMEQQVLAWINEQRAAGETPTESSICLKAKEIFQELRQNAPSSSNDRAQNDDFKASRGWFDRFKRRCGLEDIILNEVVEPEIKVEPEVMDEVGREPEAIDEVGRYVENFKNLVDDEGYTPDQVFVCDETGLYWRRMPMNIQLRRAEEEAIGVRLSRQTDKLTLLLCTNASGEFKCKPLIVNHWENPKDFRKHSVIKSKLSVMWRANPQAEMTRQFFTEWVYEEFAPSVKKYLQEKNLPLKVLLVMDRAKCHPPDLEENLIEEFSFIKVLFLSSDIIAASGHPMEFRIQPVFTKLYIKAMFKRCYEATFGTGLSLWQFWLGFDHFNLLQALRLVDKAWEEVSPTTIRSAWHKLWPDLVTIEEFRDHEEETKLVREIVALGKSMDMDINEFCVKVLAHEHLRDPDHQVIKELLREQEILHVIGDCVTVNESITIQELKEFLSRWEKMQSLVEAYHPEKSMVNKNLNSFNDNVIDYFRKILKNRITALDNQVNELSNEGAQPQSSQVSSTQAESPNAIGIKTEPVDNQPEN